MDYGVGNLRSVANAVEALGSTARILRTPAEIEGIRYNARRYVANAALYRRGLVAVV